MKINTNIPFLVIFNISVDMSAVHHTFDHYQFYKNKSVRKNTRILKYGT